jgi:hypothetical protein
MAINGKVPGKTVRKLLRQLAPFERTGHISPQLVEPNRLYDMAKAGDKNAKLLRSLIAQLLNKHTGEQWWSEKQPTPSGAWLLSALREWYAQSPERKLRILSSPAGDESERELCIKGKKAWLRKQGICYPAIFESHKASYANRSSMLIDDQWRKLESFSRNGGWGLKFPFNDGDLKIPPFVSVIYIDMDGVLVSTTGPIYNLLQEAFEWHRCHLKEVGKL